MCKSATCTNCNKKTWWGCGNHIPQVMDSIPSDDRCGCTNDRVTVEGRDYPPKASLWNEQGEKTVDVDASDKQAPGGHTK